MITSFCNCILQCCIFPLMVVVTCLLVFFIVVNICSTLQVYHAYFYLILCYIVHVNDRRLIESKHEAAKYVYVANSIQRHCHQPSTE